MKLIRWFLSVSYFSLLTYIVFFARRRKGLIWHDTFVNLTPGVRTIKAYHHLSEMPARGQWDFYSNLFGNILLFMPLPFILIILCRITSKTKIIALGACLSVLIELSQYIWQIGIPDIDDVILNTTGVIVGLFIWTASYKVKAIRRIIFTY